MNEFERRLLEVAQNHNDLVELAGAAGKGALVEHFTYCFKFNLVTPVLTILKPILSDAWFVLQYISSAVQLTASQQWLTDSGLIQLQLTDTGSGDILFSEPLSAGVLTGTISRAQSGVPMLLPIPRLISPNTIIKADVTPLTAGADAFYLVLGGSRIAQA